MSHSSEDRAFVAPLVETLSSHGIPAWYSPTNILGAQQWHDAIGEALARCDWFALILSPNAIDSMWVRRELQFALRQPRFNEQIVPVLHRPCDVSSLSWVLPDLQTVDFTGDYDHACRNLLRIWGLGYNPTR